MVPAGVEAGLSPKEQTEVGGHCGGQCRMRLGQVAVDPVH